MCGNEFKSRMYYGNRINRGKYCSKKCYSISLLGKPSHMKGKHHTEKAKEKNRIAHLGKIPWNKGIKTGIKPWLGKKRDEKTRKKISINRKGKYSNEKHPNWKGGITPENTKIRNSIEFRLWREAVFARDNWICQKTETKGGKLHSHHIQNFAQYPELRFAIDNGITLSNKAHWKFHQKYGKENNTKEQLTDFLKEQALIVNS